MALPTTPINPMVSIDTKSPTVFQEIMGNRISQLVLWGTIAIGTVGISFAIVAICVETDKDRVKTAFGILQYVFGSLLPLWGTWIGTILAYYYSKDNFESASKSVSQLVDKITSDKKLELIKAKEAMIPIEKLFYKEYKNDADDSKINLKEHFLDFIKEKGISRVILLDENRCAKYALHKSAIEGFIAEQYFNLPGEGDHTETPPVGPPPVDPQTETPPEEAPESNEQPDEPIPQTSNTPKTPQSLTFADMKAKGSASLQAILKDGVKFIKEDANLSDAKILIKNYTACNDVFITKNGLENEPVLGWITNVTIAENSIV